MPVENGKAQAAVDDDDSVKNFGRVERTMLDGAGRKVAQNVGGPGAVSIKNCPYDVRVVKKRHLPLGYNGNVHHVMETVAGIDGEWNAWARG